MAVYKQDIVDIELNSGNVHRSFLKHSIGTADAKADHFGVRTFRGGVPVDLSGVSVQGYFRNSQGTNIAITSGNIVSGNVAEVVLPQACYNYEGPFCLAIKLIGDGVTGTMRIVDGVVDNTNTGSAVAPTGAVPTYSEVLAQYDAMVAATAAANGCTAETFDATKAYSAGKYVINSGALYRLTADHAANVTWANTSKVEVKFGNELTDVKSAISDIKTVTEHDFLDSSDFEAGTIKTPDGGNSSNTATLRTSDYLDMLPNYIEVDTGYKFEVFAYNGSTYVGVWQGSEFAKSEHFITGLFDCSVLNGSYRYKLTFKKTNNATISASEISNLHLLFVTDTTLSKSAIPADAKAVGDKITALKQKDSTQDDLIDDISEDFYIYDYTNKKLSDFTTKYAGTNASIGGGGTRVGVAPNASYDTYYFRAEHDTKIYADASNINYYAICVCINPTGDLSWDGESGDITGTSAYRVRKSESNLPTRDNPITVAKGTAIFVTVTADTTPYLYYYESTGVPKSGDDEYCVDVSVSSDAVTITGVNYEVVFTKFEKPQGFQQWNITSLKGNGGNMFPVDVDIIGVIQFRGKSNFMGGVHGNEINYIFRVMSGGDDIASAGSFPDVHIVMCSHLYDVDNTSDNVVDRFVEFVFTPDGWTCRNTFKILTSTTIEVAYPSGLFAFKVSDCDGAYTNVGVLNLESTSARQLESTEFKEVTINLTDNITINICSETADKGWVTFRNTESQPNPRPNSFKVYFANAQGQEVTSGAIITGKCQYRF